MNIVFVRGKRVGGWVSWWMFVSLCVIVLFFFQGVLQCADKVHVREERRGARARACVCVCVCSRARLSVCISMCTVSACLLYVSKSPCQFVYFSVDMREKERERERAHALVTYSQTLLQ